MLACLSLLLPLSLSATPQDTDTSSGEPVQAAASGHAGKMPERSAPVLADRAPPVSASTDGASAVEASKAKKDLTGFFAIGFLINIVAIAAFLYWAAGQWRRKR